MSRCDPDISFASTKIEPLGPDLYRVTGDLTMKGTTNPFTVDVRRTGTSVDESGAARIDFAGHTQLDRTDWGVRWNAILEAGGLLIGNRVDVELSVSAVLRDAA